MIPFLDLKRQYAGISDQIEEAALTTLRGGSYVLGEAVERFEQSFADYCGTRYAIAVNSGTSALQLALLAAGVEPGDEVITVPTTFVATVAAVLYVGAVPVLIDVDPVTLTMDPTRIEEAITPRTKAILPVHFHGRLADMTEICRIADRHGITVIEDAAQAHGAERGGVRAGDFGAIGCFSFYPGKNLGAAGEGGAVTTSDPAIDERLRILRDWGQSQRQVHALRGYNFRMDAIQGAVLEVKLRHLDAWNEARRMVARSYNAGLADRVIRPAGPVDADHVYHVYAIAYSQRDALRDAMNEVGVSTNIHYPQPIHLQPAYRDLAGGPGSFPIAEAYASRTLSIPIFPELQPQEISQVISAINSFVEGQTDQSTKSEEFVS